MTGRTPIVCVLLAATAVGCVPADDDGSVHALPTDTVAVAEVAGTTDGWQTDSGISYRGEHQVDLTGDALSERVIASAAGPAYDSLQVAITIEGVGSDTLWHESWPSLLYFKYDPVEGKADTTVARIVRDHIEQLTAPDRFTMTGGLPPALSRGGDPEAVMRDAVRYHLAERDYRTGAGLSPADMTPPQAFSSINADDVVAARVDAVLEEVKASPSFMYYAGGEATYAIAWSESEGAFIRIYSCC